MGQQESQVNIPTEVTEVDDTRAQAKPRAGGARAKKTGRPD